MSKQRWYSLALAVVGLTGCTFAGKPAVVGEEALGLDAALEEPSGGADSGTSGGDQPVVTKCRVDDPTLGLCLDFESPNAFADRSLAKQATSAQNVGLTFHDASDQAAMLHTGARLTVAESSSLDVDNVTIAMWIQPQTEGNEQYLLDNSNQYGVVYEDHGDIRCMIGTNGVVRSRDSVSRSSSWTHVACTYNRNSLRVYVNGDLQGCSSYSSAIAKNGTAGTAIGGDLEPGGISKPFTGGVDLVQIYNRVLDAAEICGTATGGTNCTNDCSPEN